MNVMLPMAAHCSKRVRILEIFGVVAAFLAACLVCLSAAAAGASTAPVVSEDVPPQSADPSAPYVTESSTRSSQLKLLLNKSIVLETRTPYKRVSVSQPDIADVNLLGAGKLLVTGKKAGVTQIIVWDDGERAQVIDVSVQVDVVGLQEQFKKMFTGVKVDISANGSEVILRGNVPSLDTAQQMLEVAKPFGTAVHDFLEISGGQQVLLEVRFAEVSRTATDALGINAGMTDAASFFGSNVGGINPFGTLQGAAGGGQSLTSPSPGAGVTLFGQGKAGNSTFQYFIQALRTNNLLRVLAEPNLIAISGQEASFLAGGTIPIPISQGGTGTGAAISVVQEEYGVKLKFVPVILGDGHIRLKVSPEVSDLDYANGIQMNGFIIPGFTERKVTTTVELADGQSFAIAGLLNTSIATNKDVTPFLGDLPVIGPVFRTVSYSKKETEMVVLVTAHLVEPLNPADVAKLPGEQWREPTENELFFNQDIGGPVRVRDTEKNRNHHTPLFHGAYGFQQVGEPGNGVAQVPHAPTSLANTGRD
jgi:pilus assembly protein CpaC